MIGIYFLYKTQKAQIKEKAKENISKIYIKIQN